MIIWIMSPNVLTWTFTRKGISMVYKIKAASSYLTDNRTEVFNGLVLITVEEHDKSIPFTRRITFLQEGGQHVSVWPAQVL